MTDERAKRIISILRTPRRAGPLERVQAARDAADELEALREALKPLAELASKVPAAAPDAWTVLVTVGALRRAAEVLK